MNQMNYWDKTFLIIAIGSIIWAVSSIFIYEDAAAKWKKEISILKQELIIDENYLDNISRYRKPLWVNEKDKQKWSEWRRETADKENKRKMK